MTLLHPGSDENSLSENIFLIFLPQLVKTDGTYQLVKTDGNIKQVLSTEWQPNIFKMY